MGGYDGREMAGTAIDERSIKVRACNLTGKRFGRLTVLRRDDEKTNKHDTYWLCRCDCGKEKSVTNGHLTSGSVSSCGCLKREESIIHLKKASNVLTKHGKCGSHLYTVWNVMRQRCNNPKNPSYNWYGGKGVKVYSGWDDFAEFEKWALENGYEYLENVPRNMMLSIDRIDSDGDYCPQNCRWITIHENSVRALEKRYKNAKRTNRSTRAGSIISMDCV